MQRLHAITLWFLVVFPSAIPLSAWAQAEADIAVSITESVDPVEAGVGGVGNLVYTITVENLGPDTATSLAVAGIWSLPPGVAFSLTGSGSPDADFVAFLPVAGEFQLQFDTLNAGSSGTATIAFTVSGSAEPGTDVISTSANVSALNETDNEPDNDTDSETTSITNWARVALTKDFVDNNPAAVEVFLDCGDYFQRDFSLIEGGLVPVFLFEDFPVGTTCSISETPPPGYSPSYTPGCTMDPLVAGQNYTCIITNTPSPVQLVVSKTFTDGNTADVTVSLQCAAGTVIVDDASASAADPARFTLTDLPPEGTTCTATESLPWGYVQTSSTCTDVAVVVGDSPACEFVNAPTRASFAVSKDFTDDNPGEVEVTISCNTGLPLEQTRAIAEGEGVVFVVGDFDVGELDCTITEDGETGYIASYFDGLNTSDSGCEYEDLVGDGDAVCEITNTPAPVEVVITKEFVIEGNASGVDTRYLLTLHCNSEIIGSAQGCGFELSEAEGPATNLDWCQTFEGEGPGLFTAQVIPHYPYSSCWVEEQVFDAAVEGENGCGSLQVSAGQGDSCTITNTVFFEGIPALGEYGKLLMALLLLGAGLVAYRRYSS